MSDYFNRIKSLQCRSIQTKSILNDLNDIEDIKKNFHLIKDCHFIKPVGVLYASPICDDLYTWTNFMIECMQMCGKCTVIDFYINENARILNWEKEKEIFQKYSIVPLDWSNPDNDWENTYIHMINNVDWVQIQKDYDVIISYPWNQSVPWDCATIVVLNNDIIENLSIKKGYLDLKKGLILQ